MEKPSKITTKTSVLFSLIDEKVKAGEYVFSPHAMTRVLERGLTQEEVIDFLSGRKGYSRRWNKKKDTLEPPWYAQDLMWRYCIEGDTPDGNELRVIISFVDDLMPIITVITLNRRQ